MLALAALTLAAGLAGGLLVAVIGVRAAREPGGGAVATAVAPAAPGATPGDSRFRGAIDRALPAVVTVVADLPPALLADGTRHTAQSIGSGVVLTESGLVMTNYHVVAGAATTAVVLSTGERRAATLVADDSPFQDIAILKIPAGGLRAAVLGDSQALQQGDPVIVVSSGLLTVENQVKAGVVSALHLDFPRPGVILQEMLQTDAAVNHGDSGGALLNVRGEVVGLVTTVVRATPQGQTVEGVALAHAVHSLRPMIDAVIATGVNPRPRLGIERPTVQHVPYDSSRPAAGADRPGVTIVAVERNSPAQPAGVRTGDVITAVNGQPIADDAPFVNLLGALGARDVRLTVWRDGRLSQITVTPRAAAAATLPR